MCTIIFFWSNYFFSMTNFYPVILLRFRKSSPFLMMIVSNKSPENQTKEKQLLSFCTPSYYSSWRKMLTFRSNIKFNPPAPRQVKINVSESKNAEERISINVLSSSAVPENVLRIVFVLLKRYMPQWKYGKSWVNFWAGNIYVICGLYLKSSVRRLYFSVGICWNFLKPYWSLVSK